MKQLIALCVFLMLVSCKNQSNPANSYIFFDSAQPQDVASIAEFSKKFIGIYTLDATTNMEIQSKYIIQNDAEVFNVAKNEIDSIQEIGFRNNVVFDKNTLKPYKTTIKNDTIYWEVAKRDTVFSFRPNQIAKVFKNNIFLNTEINGKYQVDFIDFGTLGTKYVWLGTKEDFKRLKSIMTSKVDYIIENQDTLSVLLHSDKKEWKKFIKQEAFDFETLYHF